MSEYTDDNLLLTIEMTEYEWRCLLLAAYKSALSADLNAHRYQVLKAVFTLNQALQDFRGIDILFDDMDAGKYPDFKGEIEKMLSGD